MIKEKITNLFSIACLICKVRINLYYTFKMVYGIVKVKFEMVNNAVVNNGYITDICNTI